ncbi:hypothetical protein [Bacillus sp. SA1-12]|uniref:hypothetical protein n=1 Tax=Bacillus sp. SA1-12 TaxID=1455638 RepID=UPI000A57BA45|nr:hypothetical protein [Bacillus sp. SA1-12]
MLNFFKKSSKKDSNCCNIQIEEVEENKMPSSENIKDTRLNKEENEGCCTPRDEKKTCC